MRTSQNGINLIKQFEGCQLKSYKCPAGVWTIGYGHTAGVKQGHAITQAQADAYLVDDLIKFESKVEKYNKKYIWTQNEFDALVSFAYNVGNIDQLTANGTRSKQTIAEKILSYNKANGKVLAGLTRRRQAERELFLNGSGGIDITTTETSSMGRPTLRIGYIGEDVTYLQKRLAEKGYPIDYIDGIFGQKTLSAVKNLQVNYGLTVDGVVGAKTWEALGE